MPDFARRFCRRFVGAVTFAATTAGVPAAARAADFVLTIGGGPTAGESQVSLEENVLFLQRTLERSAPDLEHCILFGSGPAKSPDVCVRGPNPPPEVNELLADLFDADVGGLSMDHRPHVVASVAGPAARPAILAELDRFSKKLAAGDRLIVYASGHGGKGAPVANGVLYTWEHDDEPAEIAVRDLAAAFDAFDPAVDVVLVMVQCYAGCFANVLFVDADPAKGLAPHRRAGFFATIESREAAGCTPDVLRDDYQEYSTYFWAAAGGRNRAGRKVKAEDVDGDGRIDFREAHAHVLTNAPTIDVPSRTSDVFLRTFSSLDKTNRRLIEADRYYSRLAALADPVDRAAMDALSKELRLSGENRVHDAARRSDQTQYDRQAATEEADRKEDERRKAGGKIAAALKRRWPTVSQPWHPTTRKLLTADAAAVTAAVKKHPAYAEWTKLGEEVAALDDDADRLEKEWAKLQRLVYVAETAALAKNLETEADEEIVARYHVLVELEKGALPKK
ncbi:MAG: hypothetical protein ACRC1K_01585 [Planctomycetia bacterium]